MGAIKIRKTLKRGRKKTGVKKLMMTSTHSNDFPDKTNAEITGMIQHTSTHITIRSMDKSNPEPIQV